MRARLLAVLTTCVLGCAVLVGAPTAQAEPVASPTAAAPGAPNAAPPAFTVNGRQLDLRTTLGSAPQTEPGLYKATLPAGESTLYAKVTRAQGETLSASVSGAAREPGKPYFASGDHQLGVNFVIPSQYGGTPTDCGSLGSESLSSGDPFADLTATTYAEGAKTGRSSYVDDRCLAATTLYVEVTREAPAGAGTMPVEIQLQREPRVQGAPDKVASEAEMTALQTQPKDDDVVVKPGQGYSDATELATDGTTRLDVELGHTYYFKVRVGWGQRLGASLQAPRAAARKSPQVDTEIRLLATNPMRQPVDSATTTQMKDGTTSPQLAEVMTAPVRWSNRTIETTSSVDVTTDSAQATTAAGWYYLAVTAQPSDDGETATGVEAYPTQLTVQVQGTASAGPAFLGADNQALPAPKPGEMSVGGQDGGPGSSSLPWARIGGGVAAALLAALAMAWALRARRTA